MRCPKLPNELEPLTPVTIICFPGFTKQSFTCKIAVTLFISHFPMNSPAFSYFKLSSHLKKMMTWTKLQVSVSQLFTSLPTSLCLQVWSCFSQRRSHFHPETGKVSVTNSSEIDSTTTQKHTHKHILWVSPAHTQILFNVEANQAGWHQMRTRMSNWISARILYCSLWRFIPCISCTWWVRIFTQQTLHQLSAHFIP